MYQTAYHGFPEGRGQIRNRKRLSFLRRIMDQVNHGRFQARKAEIQRRAVHTRTREPERFRIAVLRHLIQMYAARIRHPHRAGCFVERLPGGIVAGTAENTQLCIILHLDNMGMAAGYDEAQKRRFQFWIGDVICRDVGSQMVYRDKGKSRRKGEPFGKVHAYQQGADQAGRICNGDGIYPGEGNPRLVERLPCYADNRFRMAARRNLRHDPAVKLMFLHLGGNYRRQYPAAILYHSGSCFVTRTLYSQNTHKFKSPLRLRRAAG